MEDSMLLFCIFLPIISGTLLLIFHPENQRVRNTLALAAVTLTSVLATVTILTEGSHHSTLLRLSQYLTISFRLDGLGRIFTGLLALLWPLASLYALGYMRNENHQNSFFAFFTISYGTTLGIAMAEDLMTLYIFYELLTFSTLPLVMHGMSGINVYAGRKYVYYSLGGAALAFLSLAAVMYYGGTADFTYSGIHSLSSMPTHSMLLFFFLGFIGFGVKAALFPLHGWLPTVSVAPTPVTALLHAVAVVKAGVFAIIRLTFFCFNPQSLQGSWAQTAALTLSLAGILFGSVMAVREPHLKRRLAYSTMSNLSYVLFGVLLLTPQGLAAGLMHMVYHALMKITLFSCVGAVMMKSGKNHVSDLRGMAKQMPITMAVFMLCAVALTGIPPFIGFQSKWALGIAGIQSEGILGTIGLFVLLTSAMLTAVYLLIPAFSAYILPVSADAATTRADPSPYMSIPLVILSAVMLWLAFSSKSLTAFIGCVSIGQ